MDLGLTTQTFSKQIGAREISVKGLLEKTPSFGMNFMEIRDNNGDYDLGMIRSLDDLAQEMGIRLSYGIKNELLTPEDESIFRGAVDRARILGKGTVIRMMASQDSLKSEAIKGYSQGQVEALVSVLKRFARVARENDLFLALENAREPLMGDRASYFGMGDLLERLEAAGISPTVGITFDPGNSMDLNLCKTPSKPDEVMRFLDTHSRFFHLVHLKCTQDGTVLPTIGDGDLGVKALLEGLEEREYGGCICLEIPGTGSLRQTEENLRASVEYLKSKRLDRFFPSMKA